MSITLTQSKTAICVNLTASFLAIGGAPPYSYTVRALPSGAGGSINASSGLYTAPASVNAGSFGKPVQLYDTIIVTDSAGSMATAKILVGNPLILFCDIIQTEMGLDSNHCYLWDQKLFQPTDSSLYVAVSVLSNKVFGNTNKLDPATGNQIQSLNVVSTLQLDVISRSAEARDRKEDVLLALNSTYANQQMEGNSFFIGKLPPGSSFINLSQQDGAAIPYRYSITVALQYFYIKTKPQDYFNNYQGPNIITNS